MPEISLPRFTMTARERMILLLGLYELQDNLDDINNNQLMEDGMPPILGEEWFALIERLKKARISTESGPHEPARLLGVFDAYTRDLHMPGRYTEFIVPENGKLVFAKAEHPIPSISWDAYFVTDDLTILKVAYDVTPFQPEKPDGS